MIRVVSRTSGWAYRHILKPIFFLQSPDAVHSHLVGFSRFWQKLPFADTVVAKLWAYNDQASLAQTIDGIMLPNPVGLSAGFDKNVELVPTIRSVGFGFMTGGSVTLQACSGNPRPWFYRLPKSKSLVVHAGLPNSGADQVQRTLQQLGPNAVRDFPLVVSIAKTNSPETCTDTEAIADYVGSMKQLQHEPTVGAFEINISCPNAYGGEPFTTPERLEALLSEIDLINLDKPVWMKMPISMPWPAFDALLQVIVRHPLVSAVTIGNLHKDRTSIQLAEPLPASVLGNLSGLPTQKLSNDLIAQTYQIYGEKLTIIGVGGIFSAEDAYRKICLGASLVELITGMIFEGPQLIGQINRGLVRLMERDGFTHISQAVGSAHRGASARGPAAETSQD